MDNSYTMLAVDPGNVLSAMVFMRYNTKEEELIDRWYLPNRYIKRLISYIAYDMDSEYHLDTPDDLESPVSTKKLCFGKELSQGERSKAVAGGVDIFAIEMLANMGNYVGSTVFETAVWIGRFLEKVPERTKYTLITRVDAKMCVCGMASAKDKHVTAAMLERFGPGKEKAVGRKKSPGPLYGVKGDIWAALAVGCAYIDLWRQEQFNIETRRPSIKRMEADA